MGAGLLVVACALVACGGGASTTAAAGASGFKTVAAASLKVGQAVPAPATAPIVTVIGGTAPANTDGGVAFDLASLERLGLVSATVFEPYEKKHLNFSGVTLAAVLNVAGVPSTANVHLTALDDYQVDLTAQEIAAGGVMLATQLDGHPIAVASGGPTRLVFLDGTASGKDGRQWIWSISRIDVKA